MKEYYKIGEISNLYNIGTDSLRYYEELGILSPRRDINGYRMYNINDIRKLNILRELRSIGFSMDEIKEHLSDFNLEKTVALFLKAIDTIDKKMAEMETLKSQLSKRVKEIEFHISQETDNGKIEVVKFAERHILRLSENVLRDDDLDFVIKKLQREYEDQLYIIGNGDIGATAPLDYLRAGNYGRFDSAFYIVGDNEEHDALLPSGDYLCMTVKGSYSQIAPSWKKIFDYSEEKGLTPSGNPIELYIIDNHDTGDETEYVTQLQLPLG